MDEALTALSAAFPLLAVHRQRPDLAFATVAPAHFVPAATLLRDQEGFAHLVLLTAVDWLERDVFQLTCLLHRPTGGDLGLRVEIPRDAPSAEGLHHLWPAAATYQRELKEMFGIHFPDSPGVDEPFILESWAGPPPYRRDFDTRDFAERNFAERPGRATHEPAAWMRQQLWPEG